MTLIYYWYSMFKYKIKRFFFTNNFLKLRFCHERKRDYISIAPCWLT